MPEEIRSVKGSGIWRSRRDSHGGLRLRRATLYPAELRVHPAYAVLTRVFRDCKGLDTPCVSQLTFLLNPHQPDLSWAFGEQRSSRELACDE